MREIKFRAWDKNNAEMFDLNPVWFEENNWQYKDFAKCAYEEGVIILQYTGLKDRNGVDIYESDVIRSSFGIPPISAEVYFDNGCFCTSTKDSDTNETTLINFLDRLVEVEVIGNIYQHPYLLNKE